MSVVSTNDAKNILIKLAHVTPGCILRIRSMGLLRALFSFKGRLNRREYASGIFIFVFLFGVLFEILFDKIGAELGLVFFVALMWMFFAVLAKRMHDIGRTGWVSLAVFIPMVGLFIPFVLVFYPGEPNLNLSGEPRPGWFVEP